MKRLSVLVLLHLFFLSLWACQSIAANSNLSLDHINSKNPKWSVPFSRFSEELIVINVNLNDQTRPMLLDTGATQSALFSNALPTLGLQENLLQRTDVYGLTGQQLLPTTLIKKMSFAGLVFKDEVLTILPQRGATTNTHEVFTQKSSVDAPVGLLGMNILGDYNLYIDNVKNVVNFIPSHQQVTLTDPQWLSVPMASHLPNEEDRGLHFLILKISNTHIYALLDTGADFNAINWSSSAAIWQLRARRKKLHEDWVVQGAVGEFEPTITIAVKNMHSKQKVWPEALFIVMDMDDLEILGIKNKPFIIAGMPLLRGEEIFIDFKANKLWFRSENKRQIPS